MALVLTMIYIAGKHQQLKQYGNCQKNFQNIGLTLMKRCQFIAYHLVTGKQSSSLCIRVKTIRHSNSKNVFTPRYKLKSELWNCRTTYGSPNLKRLS